MKRIFLAIAVGLMATTLGCQAQVAKVGESWQTNDDKAPVVYFIKDISPESLMKIYNALGVKAEGNRVGIKISTGESLKSNYLNPELIKNLVQSVNGTFIECNTAYPGNRMDTETHRHTAEEHGFTRVAPVDIMDAEGDTALPVANGKHLNYDLVGKNFLQYDYMMVLSHFKGHAMGGFGGALKNISIGIGSGPGKALIHSAGKTNDLSNRSYFHTDQIDFLESMAEAAEAVHTHMNGKAMYINIANRLSVDCDCDGDPEAPKMGDIGIFASLDPVAVDQACVDAVFNSKDPGCGDLQERINSRKGVRTLEHAAELGVGSRNYRLVTLE